MAATRQARPVDPEFDPSPDPTPRLRDFDPLEHQRLVVNPFLAVLGLLGLAWVAVELLPSLLWPILPALGGLLAMPLAFLPHLIHYHCLDCGRTGTYPRRRGHACSGVHARSRRGGRFRIPFPPSGFQLAAWGWALAAAAVLLAVAAWT